MRPYVLLVEDDDDDVQLALMGFRRERLEQDIVVARDGKEAIDLLTAARDAAVLPEAIVTDLKMPRMDGLELLRRIKEDPRLNAIPVAFLTSSGHPEDQREAATLGVSEYMRKPSDLDEYADVVGKIRRLIGARAPA